MDEKQANGRFAILALVMLAMMMALILQLGNLTLAKGAEYAAKRKPQYGDHVYHRRARPYTHRNGIPSHTIKPATTCILPDRNV